MRHEANFTAHCGACDRDVERAVFDIACSHSPRDSGYFGADDALDCGTYFSRVKRRADFALDEYVLEDGLEMGKGHNSTQLTVSQETDGRSR